MRQVNSFLIFLIAILLLLSLSALPAMAATRVRAFDALTGGSTNDMDAVDGDNITAGDFALTTDSSGNYYVHYFVVSGDCTGIAAAGEDSPNVIVPDSCSGDTTKGYWKLATSFTTHPSATPGIYGEDSDYANDPVIQIIGNSTDGMDGEVIFKVQEGDSLVTYMELDGANEWVNFKEDIRVEGTARFLRRVYSFATTVTTSDYLSGTHYILTANGAELTIPDCDTGAVGVWYTIIKPDSGEVGEIALTDTTNDVITFGSTALTAGNELDSPSTANANITLMCVSANNWMSLGAIEGAWANGGAPD